MRRCCFLHDDQVFQNGVLCGLIAPGSERASARHAPRPPHHGLVPFGGKGNAPCLLLSSYASALQSDRKRSWPLRIALQGSLASSTRDARQLEPAAYGRGLPNARTACRALFDGAIAFDSSSSASALFNAAARGRAARTYGARRTGPANTGTLHRQPDRRLLGPNSPAGVARPDGSAAFASSSTAQQSSACAYDYPDFREIGWPESTPFG